MQFLVKTRSLLPADFDPGQRRELLAAEQERCRELVKAGKILGQWRIPIARETVTIWDVAETRELHELFTSLPGSRWADAEAIALVGRDLQAHDKDPSGKIA